MLHSSSVETWLHGRKAGGRRRPKRQCSSPGHASTLETTIPCPRPSAANIECFAGPTPAPKGKAEFEDRSHHTNISRRRQRAALVNELFQQFYGVGYNADGTSYICDEDNEDDPPQAQFEPSHARN